MQYSQEHLKTMVYAEFGGQTECIMGNWKIENRAWYLFRIPMIHPGSTDLSTRYLLNILGIQDT